MTQPTTHQPQPSQQQPTAPPQQQPAGQQPSAGQQSPVPPPNPMQLAAAGPQKSGQQPQQTGEQPGQQPNAKPGEQPTAKSAIEQALATERDRRQSLEKSVADALGIKLESGGDNPSHYEQITAKLAPLAKIATALQPEDPEAAKGKTEVELLNERFTQYEQTIAKERDSRWRTEIAYAKGLTPSQATRLNGKSLEELTADADACIADGTFVVQPAQQQPGQQGQPQQFVPGQMRPDPTQGTRGTGGEIDARIAQAERDGDVEGSIGLLVDKHWGNFQQ